MAAQKKTAHIDIRVEPALLQRIDAWREMRRRAIRLPVTRSGAVVHMIEYFLEQDNA